MRAELRLRDGRYSVLGVLGEGTQGTTYEALDLQNGPTVAIKRFDVRGAKCWKDVELAEREARVLATLDHPLFPRYIEHFEDDGHLFLVMEKIEGETMESLRQRVGPMPEDEVRRFLACADRALTYLHGRASPVVHRDLKPRNIVRRPDGSYVFVDFGAVREIIARRGASTVVGTLGYMAPEQLQGRALPGSDVYAIGATAVAALAGADPEDLPHRGLRIDVRAALHGRASPALIASLERMVEPDPDLRATSLAAALDGVSSVPPPPPPLLRRVVTMPAGPLPDEDATVASVRKLLWVMWGLGWVIVPLVVGKIARAAPLIPVIMFGSLAALIVVTWHEGALIRFAWRALSGTRGTARVGSIESRARELIDGISPPRVRVHSGDLKPDDLLGRTEIEPLASVRAREAARTYSP